MDRTLKEIALECLVLSPALERPRTAFDRVRDGMGLLGGLGDITRRSFPQTVVDRELKAPVQQHQYQEPHRSLPAAPQSASSQAQYRPALRSPELVAALAELAYQARKTSGNVVRSRQDSSAQRANPTFSVGALPEVDAVPKRAEGFNRSSAEARVLLQPSRSRDPFR